MLLGMMHVKCFEDVCELSALLSSTKDCSQRMDILMANQSDAIVARDYSPLQLMMFPRLIMKLMRSQCQAYGTIQFSKIAINFAVSISWGIFQKHVSMIYICHGWIYCIENAIRSQHASVQSQNKSYALYLFFPYSLIIRLDFSEINWLFN